MNYQKRPVMYPHECLRLSQLVGGTHHCLHGIHVICLVSLRRRETSAINAIVTATSGLPWFTLGFHDIGHG